MIPLHTTPLGRLKIGKHEPKVVERGLIVHVRRELRAEITYAHQIPRAFRICSPYTNWKKPRWGRGRMYRQFPQDETLPFGVGSILVKPLTRHEGEWLDYLDVPEYREEKVYQGGKIVQWCGMAPEVYHPAELLTTEDFLAECKKHREKISAQEALELRIKQFNGEFEALGFDDVNVCEDNGEVQIQCTYGELRRILDRIAKGVDTAT